LVTSSPSRDYLYRVVNAFNDNGAGVRGDLKAVIKAVLLDYEARSSTLGSPDFWQTTGAVVARHRNSPRSPRTSVDGGTYSQNGREVVSITTTNAHRLITGDIVWLTFSDTSGQPAPYTQGYRITATSPTSFTVVTPGSPRAPTLRPLAPITQHKQYSGEHPNHGLIAGNPFTWPSPMEELPRRLSGL
jgi:hypothetical protein